MPYSIVTCRCKDQGDPTPRFCRDDLFCPQCGQSVAWIDSEHFLPAPEAPGSSTTRQALWVYPRDLADGTSVYELTIDFYELDPGAGDGESRPRVLELAPDGCIFKAPGFETKTSVGGGVGSRAVLRLLPVAPNDVFAAGGVRGRLILAGNCGVAGKILAGRPGEYDSLDVFVFNKPYFSVTVEGEGVQDQREPRDTWQLWKEGLQPLTLLIEPTTAQVFLAAIGPKPSWPVEDDPEMKVKILEKPIASTRYGPGRAAVVVLELNPDGWQPQESQPLKLKIDFALGQSLDLKLSLKRQAEGMLTWSTGNPLIVAEMYYGETVETPPATPRLLPEISISNDATTPLQVKVPRSMFGTLPTNEKWIEVGWPDGSEISQIIEKGKPKSLRLNIDLSSVNPGNHPPGDPLKAEVRVQHASFGMTWKLSVMINKVGYRPPLDAPLALDFGNTNSYASAEIPGADENDPITVRSLLERTDDPETFASVLAFRDLDDAANPSYEIGQRALDLGKARPLFLERGLKRALSTLKPSIDARGARRELDDPNHEFNKGRYIYPRETGDSVRYSLRDLIRLYILEAIHRCEVGERRTVTELGLSYPANLGPEPRRALNLVIRDVEKECRARHPEWAARIAFRELGPDEASAVALGFVLDPENLEKWIIPLFKDDEASFLLASFDFGGGSIDIALIRFQLVGEPPWTTFSSTLLGLGGAEHFGGDNVTVAAYEILALRIKQALGPDQELPLAPLNFHRNRAEPRGWTNRQALWSAAEAAKRAACRGMPAAARDEIKAEIEKLHAEDKESQAILLAELAAGRLDIPLTEIYEHSVVCDLSGMKNYTVAARLAQCVETLTEFVKRAGFDASLQFLVLAGAACRVPLARDLLRSAFPDALIVPEGEDVTDAYRPKSKVADGLARFLKASGGGTTDPRTKGLKSANLFTHADLLWINPLMRKFPVPWVPSCTDLQEKDWHPLRPKNSRDRVVPLSRAWNSKHPQAINVHRSSSPEPELVGTAMLGEPADLIEPGVTPHLPAPSADLDESTVLLRIDGEEDRLRLRIRCNGQEYGDWSVRAIMTPEAIDPSRPDPTDQGAAGFRSSVRR